MGKLPEIDALNMAYKAVNQGAAGVDMGRNIFQSDCPSGMLEAVNAVVHKGKNRLKQLKYTRTENLIKAIRPSPQRGLYISSIYCYNGPCC